MLTVNLNELRDRCEAPRREWEELDTAHTSYAMRKGAETRYLTLRALLRRVEPVRGGGLDAARR